MAMLISGVEEGEGEDGDAASDDAFSSHSMAASTSSMMMCRIDLACPSTSTSGIKALAHTRDAGNMRLP